MLLDFLDKYATCPVCQKSMKLFSITDHNDISDNYFSPVTIQNFNIYNSSILLDLKTQQIKCKKTIYHSEFMVECKAKHFYYVLDLHISRQQKIENITLNRASLNTSYDKRHARISTNFILPQTKILLYGSTPHNQEFILNIDTNLLEFNKKKLHSFLQKLILLS